MKKKLLALALVLVFVLGTVATGFAGTFTDVVDTDFEDEVNRLVALGVINGYPDGTYKPEGLVTRAEFAKIVVTATGVGAAAEYAKGATKFTDVAAEHWAAGYINVATDLGIIQGYGDGRFGPEDQVTYAQAITMIVRSLGYEPAAAAKGGYPGGYLAVAAEEDITDGITVVANVAANRGDIAIMVDNSLEVDMMVQSSYGDKPTWEVKEGETLLKKLGVDEIEGNVVEIARVNDKLDDNEIVIRFEEEGKKDKTYELVTKDTPEALFGLSVKLLAKNSKVVHVEVDTDAKDVLVDTADVFEPHEYEGNKLDEKGYFELKVADKKYYLDEDAKVYVNFEGPQELVAEEDDEFVLDADKTYYGTFILDGKEIKFANLFAFAKDDVGLVTKVAKDEVEYEALDGDDVLYLDDYDDVYVYNKDFTAASLDDIDENSVIYYWDNEDDEVFIVVVNEVVTGEVTRARDGRVTVDGKNYDKGAFAMVSTDDGDDFSKWEDVDDVKDLIDEKVTLYLDLNGDVLAVVGEADVVSDTLYGIATWYEEGRKPVLTIFTAEGKEVDYYFDDKAETDKLPKDGEKIVVEDKDGKYAVVSYTLNSDGEIDEIEKVGGIGDIIEALEKGADKKFVEKDSTRFYITKDTVIMKALDSKGEFEPEVITYEELVKMEIKADGDAYVFGTAGKNAKFIVFTEAGFKGVKDDIYFGVVTEAPEKLSKDWAVEIDVFGEGKAEYTAKDDILGKGYLVVFELDSKEKVAEYVYSTVEGEISEASFGEDAKLVKGTIAEVKSGFVTLEGEDTGTYKLLDGAKIYKVKYSKGEFKLDGTTSLRKSNADNADEIVLLLDDGQVKAALVNPTGTAW